MRALQLTRAEGRSLVALIETDQPCVGPDQVLVRVSHSGVSLAELRGPGQRPPEPPHVPGVEVGVVADVGLGVTSIVPGDRVGALTLSGGGHAELAVADAQHTVLLDGALAEVPDQRVAAVLGHGTGAVGAIELCGRSRGAEHVVLPAAAGGLAGCLIDLLYETPARITAVTSEPARLSARRRERCGQVLGYDEVDLLSKVDVVFDATGGLFRGAVRHRLARHVVLGDAVHGDVTVAYGTLWRGSVALSGYQLAVVAEHRPDLVARHLQQSMRRRAEAPLEGESILVQPEELGEVHRSLLAGRTTGKSMVDW